MEGAIIGSMPIVSAAKMVDDGDILVIYSCLHSGCPVLTAPEAAENVQGACLFWCTRSADLRLAVK